MHAPRTTAAEGLAQIKEALGEPAYSGQGVLLYQGDCLQMMSRLPEELFDLTVTSPPYNIGKEYERTLPLSGYLDWCERWIAAVHRLTKSNGAFWLNLGYVSVDSRGRAVPLPYLLWDKVPFFLLQEIVWHYGAGVACKNCFSPRNEKFLWYIKDAADYVFNLDDVRDLNVKYPKQKKNGKLRCNPAGKNPGDVWIIPKVTSGKDRSSKERTIHPAQFPRAVIDRIVLASSHPGGLILEPFAGSGTTLEAAIKNKRHAVGFEIDARYVATATERLLRLERVGLRSDLVANE